MRFAPVFSGLLLLLGTLRFGPQSTALDVATLNDPRPSAHWSLDESERLTSATRAALDDLGSALKSATGHEQVVVCVASTDGENQRTFATRLFNRWGLGDRVRNDGVLLFIALDDRRVEFILGDGIDSDAQVALTQQIVNQDMLPRFRSGDHNAAVLAGANASARRLLGFTDAGNPASTPAQSTLRSAADDVPLTEQPVESDSTQPLTPHTSVAIPTATHHQPVPYSLNTSWGFWGFLGGSGGVGFLMWRRWLRNRPRNCDRCQQPMVRLGEHQDDQHLNHSEQTEERVGSVDYDIWSCTACSHVLKLRYGTWFTRYARCPRCQAVTKSSNETTLVAATYDHGGQVRVDEACVACDYRNSFTRSTPKKTRSSTSRSSGGGGGGGRSSGRGGGGGW